MAVATDHDHRIRFRNSLSTKSSLSSGFTSLSLVPVPVFVGTSPLPDSLQPCPPGA